MKAAEVLPFSINRIWLECCRSDHRRFMRSLENPALAQEQYLKHLLQKNAGTQCGRDHRFYKICSVQDFAEQVPLTQYEDYLPYIELISQGKSAVLTRDPVVLFQPTSGTSSASKLIPYTRTLKAEYQRAIAAWIYQLYRRNSALMQGRAYWSISPAVEREKFHGCIPVGFDDDSEYLGLIGKRLFRLVSVGQERFAQNTTMDEFWDQTLISLLAARNLTLISVWSPTFLLTLIKHFAANWAEILETLAQSALPGAQLRARECQKLIQRQGLDFEAIWPRLKLISCWTHGSSRIYLPEIRRYFPNLEIQGKGLVATEAFVSLPLLPDTDPLPALNSHFFEFRDLDTGEIRLVHQLRKGGLYSVIVTTGGGLYRYQLNDLVKVTGFTGAVPTLCFISKDAVSDLCGEKLNTEHVQRNLAETFALCHLEPDFFLVAPVRSPGQKLAYALFLHAPNLSDARGRELNQRLEELFCQNYHYAYCRRLGQLDALKLFLIDGLEAGPTSVYLAELYQRGHKPGAVKPPVLDRESGWENRFTGRFLDNSIS